MIRVFVEGEAGSRERHRYDESTLEHRSTVTLAVPHPYPYGFVLDTRGADGDAVDCFVITAQPLAHGATVECRPIGVLEQVEDGEPDPKLLAAMPGEGPAIGADLRAELAGFIEAVFAEFPDARVEVGNVRGVGIAEHLLRRTANRDTRGPK